ncbi:MAG: hypothetical protein ACRD3M_17305 [Thermoanaerobaculia bacterium]
MVRKKEKAKAGTRAGRKRARKKTTGVKRSVAARKSSKRTPKSKPRKSTRRAATGGARARKPRAGKRMAAAGKSSLGGGMYRKGGWKSDKESVPEFSQTDNVEALADAAAEELEPDLRDSKEEDAAQGAQPGAEEEPEW